MSLFDPAPPGAGPSPAHSVESLRRAAARSRRRFLIWNGCCFAAVMVVPVVMGSGFATGIGGGLTVSLLVFPAQAMLLTVTAGRFDRDFRTRYDPLSAPESAEGASR